MGNAVFGLFFLEIPGDELADGFDGCISIRAFRADGNDRAVTCGKHHQSHDAFTVHFLAVFFYVNITLEPVRGFDELGGRAGVDAEFVLNGEFFFGHGGFM